MAGALREVSLCCPCVQHGRCGPFGLDAAPLVMPAVSDEDVGGRQFVHLGGVGKVAGDVGLRGLVIAGAGVWDDVVGCSLVVGSFTLRVQFEWGLEWFRRPGVFSGLFRVASLLSQPRIVRSRSPGLPPGSLLL